MPYEADYVLRLIEQLSALVRGAKQRLGVATPVDAEEVVSDKQAPEELTSEALGLVLDMDPLTAARLSPTTLSTMLQLGDVHPEVLRLLVETIELDVQAFALAGRASEADTRRAQASAVRTLIGDPPR